MKKGRIGHHIIDNSNAINYEKLHEQRLKCKPHDKKINLGIFFCQ
jgi:hypothetical protein